MRAFHLVPLILAGALAGCGSGGPPGNGGAGASAPAAADAPVVTPANVALTPKGAPMRRAGYWQVTRDEAPAPSQFHCVDNESEAKFSLFDWLAMVGECSKKDFKRTADGWSFDTQCSMMNMTTEQKGTLSGDFQNVYVIDQEVTTGGHGSEKGVLRGKWVGQCPAGLKPGDFAGSDGKKMGNTLGQ